VSSSSKQAIIGLGSLAAVLVVIVIVSSMSNRLTGLRADVLSARRAEPGDEVIVTVSVRDTKGAVQSVSVDFGDRSPLEERGPTGAACAKPLSALVDFPHRYLETGTYTVVASVVTGGCGAETETDEALRTIEVKALRR
jgi:hypothetical protein